MVFSFLNAIIFTAKKVHHLLGSELMYRTIKIDDDRVCLFDSETVLPTFLTLMYCVHTLHYKSANYQESELTNLKHFHHYWLDRYSNTLDYSVVDAEFSEKVFLKLIESLDGFWLYLDNSKRTVGNVTSLNGQSSGSALPTLKRLSTNAACFQSVCRFLDFLINHYVSLHYIAETPSEVDGHRRSLLHLLSARKSNYKHLLPHNGSGQYKSLTAQQFADFVTMFPVSTNPRKDDQGRLSNSAYRQYRNHILVRLLSNYGLRIGEALLLRRSSFRTNMAGNTYYMQVANLEDGVDPRKNKLSVKTASSVRVLKITRSDYLIVQKFFEQIELLSVYDFLFTSSLGEYPPLSYQGALKIITDASSRMQKEYPYHFSSEFVDSISGVHPHMLRHTWAYLQLQYLYRKHQAKFISAGANNPKGIMQSAIDDLRALGGWTHNSTMPAKYAKRFIAERANELNVARSKDVSATNLVSIGLPKF